MKISEIFLSIEGEGIRTGEPAIFIRSYGCNLKCSYCFGVKPGRHIPKLRRGYLNTDYRGNHKFKITEANVGDWIMTYDDDMNLVETQITEYTSRKVTEWYEVTIDNVLYYITPEHPIFTIHGLKRVDELKSGDIIIECDPNKYLSYMSSVRNCMKEPEVCTKQHAHMDYTAIGQRQRERMVAVWDQIHQLIEDGTPFKDWPDECYNRYSVYQSKECRQKISDSKKGELNPNYRPDAIHRYNYEALKADVRAGKITRSQLSGKTLEEDNASYFCVHHIDGDDTNDAWGNLIVVTSREHNQIHQRGYSFWKSDRKDGKRLSKVVDNNGKVVQSIKHIDITQHPHYSRPYGPSPLVVYTLKCEPYNTYLIDNMWVHNCDSLYATCSGEYTEMSISDIVQELLKYKWCNKITFTGGEPLIQKDAIELLDILYEAGYEVNVETDGAIALPVRLDKRDKLIYTMDWKSISSGMSDRMIAKNLDLLNENDVLKFVVSTDEDLEQMKEVIQSHNLKCHIFVSPIFGEIEPKNIVEFVLENKLSNVRVQLQIHKLIWDKDMRGV